jgi:alkanesulfonate monooxygenase SsuD/methylene tetrahydromethanopterin reductase-like flavin-dependent oxidoreductase (luciferase family)
MEAPDMVQFSYFHLMPYPELSEINQWPVPHKLFDPAIGHKLYHEYLDQMALADELGFNWVGCNEHHSTPYGLMSNPNLIGAVLATRTKNARLAMLGNLIPLLNPLRVAEEYAMLDVLSGGRLIAGFIRGVPNEYIAYSANPDESWERFTEAYDLIVRAWTEPEPFAWEGKHWQFRAVSVWPRPLQQPHPPILISGGSKESAVFAAQKRAKMGIVQLVTLEDAKANAQLYRDSAVEAGWTPAPDDVLVGLHTHVGRTDAEAQKALGDAEEYFYSVLGAASGHAGELVLSGTKYYVTEEARQFRVNRRSTHGRLTIQDRVDRNTVLCGSPETVIRQIQAIVKATGAGVLQVNFKIGCLSNEQVSSSMRLFAEEVLPHVRDL